MSVTTKKWGLDTVEKLSAPEIKELKQYLEYLMWKSQIPIGNLRDLPKPKRKGQPKQILAAINKSHYVAIEDAEALLHSIKDGEIPIRFYSTFDESEGE